MMGFSNSTMPQVMQSDVSRVVTGFRDYMSRYPEEADAASVFIDFLNSHPSVFERAHPPGHFTGSAWLVSVDDARVLLMHHRKLDRWLQPGGHADGDPDLRAVALREAREESGLTRLRVVGAGIFDVDRHEIPERGTEPAHRHYDLRFIIEADPAEPLRVTRESKELAWVRIADVVTLNPEESMARMVRKTLAAGG